ncbi:HTH-like domain-containing protein [Streptomyces hygroscopicus]|nr:HTH-like domain-containing protein [Streptomyces hygroscopicus]
MISPHTGATYLPDRHTDLRVAVPDDSILCGQERGDTDPATRARGSAPPGHLTQARPAGPCATRHPDWAAAAAGGNPRPDHPARRRELPMGLPTRARRTAPPRAQSQPRHRPAGTAACPPPMSSTQTPWHCSGSTHCSSWRCVPAPSISSGSPPTPPPPGPPSRPGSSVTTRRPRGRIHPSHPRPGREIHGRLRRRVHQRRHHCDQDPSTQPQLQPTRRTLHPLNTGRVHRPGPALPPWPRREDPPRLHTPLQQPPTPPRPRPTRTQRQPERHPPRPQSGSNADKPSPASSTSTTEPADHGKSPSSQPMKQI